MINDKPSVLDKPTIPNLVQALRDEMIIEKSYSEMDRQTAQNNFYNDERWQKAHQVIVHNENYLRSNGANSINKKNLAKLIDAIHSDGKFHFNMTVFFGMIANDDLDNMIYEGVNNFHPSAMDFKNTNENMFNSLTNSFNCNSVGCIAGFASALALDWKEGFTGEIGSTINPARAWEHIACNYLNIPLQVGQKIFYAENGSVWSLLKVQDYNFNELEYDDDTEYGICEGDIYEDDWEQISINLTSITYKKATEMLSMILEGEIEFDEHFSPYLTAKYRVKQS